MQRFLITPENRIVTVSPEATVPEGSTAFHSEKELLKATGDWPASRLVTIWNRLPGVTAVRKFKDRATAVSRIWKEAQKLPPVAEGPGKKVRASKATQDTAKISDAVSCVWRGTSSAWNVGW